jgi:chromosome partitioning protein
VIPIQAEYLALEGLSVMLRIIEQVREAGNPGLQIEGIVLTMYDPRTSLAQQVAAEVQKHFGDRLFNTFIPRNIRLSEAPSHGRPVLEYDTASKGAQAYRLLARELLGRQGAAAANPPSASSAYAAPDESAEPFEAAAENNLAETAEDTTV